MKRILPFVLAIALCVAGCSSSGGGTSFDVCSAESLVKTQQTAAIGYVTVMIALNKTGQVSASQIAKLKGIYTSWATAQQAAVSFLTTANDAGGNLSSVQYQQWIQLGVQMAVLAAEIYSMYNSANTPPKSGELLAARAGATTCSITDAQIQSDLTVPTWAALGGP